MDHKKKLMATPSCQGQGVHAETMVDRISNLPDEVAHHILSFLTMIDVTRFGRVSKRCGQLHLSTPTLKFEKNSEANWANLSIWNMTRMRLRRLYALDRFMIRRGDVKIQTFRFRNFCRDNKSRIINLIHNALRCNVEVLDLELDLYDLTPLFQSILHCGSLRYIYLEMQYKPACSLTLPSSACFSNIGCLKLKNIDVVDKGFFRWISSSCKCIKELLLERIEGIHHLSIESLSLESFSYVHPFRSYPFNLSISADKLVDLVIDWGFLNYKKFLSISAPKVKYMKWTGNLLIHQNLGELICLEKAELYLRPGGNDFNILSEFLLSIRRVKALTINEETLQALFVKGSMPAILDNVRQLRMHVGYFPDDLVPAMVSLLKGLPNLSILYINSYDVFVRPRTKSSRYNVAYWKLLNLAFVDQLEEVTIELPNGSNGIELAWYMLDYAQSLKKMVIVHSPHQSNVERKFLKRKNSNVRVVFLEDQGRGTLAQIRRSRLSNKG